MFVFVDFIILVWNSFQSCCNYPCRAFFTEVKSRSVAELEYGCGQVNVNVTVDLLPSFIWRRADYCTGQIWQPNLFLTFFFLQTETSGIIFFLTETCGIFGGVCRLAGPIYLVWSKGQAGFRFKEKEKKEKKKWRKGMQTCSVVDLLCSVKLCDCKCWVCVCFFQFGFVVVWFWTTAYQELIIFVCVCVCVCVCFLHLFYLTHLLPWFSPRFFLCCLRSTKLLCRSVFIFIIMPFRVELNWIMQYTHWWKITLKNTWSGELIKNWS